MRIGLHIGPMKDFPPVQQFMDFVKKAEDLGFDPLLFSDSVSLSQFHLRDPYTILALAAQATRSATVGTCVTNTVTRHLYRALTNIMSNAMKFTSSPVTKAVRKR